MDNAAALAALRADMARELTRNILPFWMDRTPDRVRGGFVGQIGQGGEIVADAPRGAVLNARILWTFSAAYRVLGADAYRDVALRARDYLLRHFWDDAHGGVFWTVDAGGAPLETRKQTYAQAFALYGLAEHYRATGDGDSLEKAVALYHLVETHAADGQDGGYLEALGRNWQPIGDVRLSSKDLNAPKSMNTHLHVLEAYTALYLAWPDAALGARLRALVALFLDRILDRDTHHLKLFFELDWTPVGDVVSYGHDIEASWLLVEAATVLGDAELRARVRAAALDVARATVAEGQDADGAVYYEKSPDGGLDADRHWWVQAEAVVGFLNAYAETDDAAFLDAARAAWQFIQRHVVDGEGGEWLARLDPGNRPYAGEDKVGLWKCPYHNARACLEGIVRLDPARPLHAHDIPLP